MNQEEKASHLGRWFPVVMCCLTALYTVPGPSEVPERSHALLSVRLGLPARQAPPNAGSEAQRQPARLPAVTTKEAKEPAPVDAEGAGVTVQERGRTSRTETGVATRTVAGAADRGLPHVGRAEDGGVGAPPPAGPAPLSFWGPPKAA